MHEKVIEARAYPQNPVLRGGPPLRPDRGHHPGAGDGARHQGGGRRGRCAAGRAGEAKCIVFNFSGHGHFDLAAYDAYLEGKLKDIEIEPDEMIQKALATCRKLRNEVSGRAGGR